MFRAISSHLRPLPHTLITFSKSSSSSSSTPTHSLFRLPIDPSLSIPISPAFSNSPSRQRHDNSGNDEVNRDPESPPKLFVVQPRLRPDTLLQSKLEEALNLANSLEEQRDGFFDSELCDKELPRHVVVQNPAARSIRSDTYFGTGTVSTIKCHLNASESEGELDAVFVNAILSGVQQRNLERAWGIPVLDRVGLIIEIFNAHAFTKEAKLQAELAALMYKKTRLVRVRGLDGRLTFGASGEAEVVSARGRGSGGRGFISGAGETELQLQRRRIIERRNQLLSEIKEVRRTRALQRASRKRHGGSNGEVMATVAVVGYTNAGKSTLVSVLSDSDLYSDDRLFATVDPKMRSVVLPSGRKALLSDTVGFISDLPVQLVEAFHATLEEVAEADLLVHVLDSSTPNVDEHRDTVLQVLQQIGVSKEKLQNMIEVWNKIDLQQEEMDGEEYLDGVEIISDADVDEDDDMESEKVSGELTDDCDSDYDDDKSSGLLPGGDVEESMGTRVDDDWPSSLGRGKDALYSRRRLESPDDHQSEKDLDTQPENTESIIKTSAVMGTGLQELLEAIDAKIETQNIVERGVFDRKWRPPRKEDSGMAVEK